MPAIAIESGKCRQTTKGPPKKRERESTARRELEIEKSEKVAALSLSLEGGKSYNTRV